MYSRIEEWSHASGLKYTLYDVEETGGVSSNYPVYGKVKTAGGRLNLREEPSTKAKVLKLISNGDELLITGKMDGWYSVVHDGIHGYVSSEYVVETYKACGTVWTITCMVKDESLLNEVTAYLKGIGCNPEVSVSGGD